MRFALDERVVGPIAAYLGVVPVLNELDDWYNAGEGLGAPERCG
jgi:hypothetical protein